MNLEDKRFFLYSYDPPAPDICSAYDPPLNFYHGSFCHSQVNENGHFYEKSGENITKDNRKLNIKNKIDKKISYCSEKYNENDYYGDENNQLTNIENQTERATNLYEIDYNYKKRKLENRNFNENEQIRDNYVRSPSPAFSPSLIESCTINSPVSNAATPNSTNPTTSPLPFTIPIEKSNISSQFVAYTDDKNIFSPSATTNAEIDMLSCIETLNRKNRSNANNRNSENQAPKTIIEVSKKLEILNRENIENSNHLDINEFNKSPPREKNEEQLLNEAKKENKERLKNGYFRDCNVKNAVFNYNDSMQKSQVKDIKHNIDGENNKFEIKEFDNSHIKNYQISNFENEQLETDRLEMTRDDQLKLYENNNQREKWPEPPNAAELNKILNNTERNLESLSLELCEINENENNAQLMKNENQSDFFNATIQVTNNFKYFPPPTPFEKADCFEVNDYSNLKMYPQFFEQIPRENFSTDMKININSNPNIIESLDTITLSPNSNREDNQNSKTNKHDRESSTTQNSPPIPPPRTSSFNKLPQTILAETPPKPPIRQYILLPLTPDRCSPRILTPIPAKILTPIPVIFPEAEIQTSTPKTLETQMLKVSETNSVFPMSDLLALPPELDNPDLLPPLPPAPIDNLNTFSEPDCLAHEIRKEQNCSQSFLNYNGSFPLYRGLFTVPEEENCQFSPEQSSETSQDIIKKIAEGIQNYTLPKSQSYPRTLEKTKINQPENFEKENINILESKNEILPKKHVNASQTVSSPIPFKPKYINTTTQCKSLPNSTTDQFKPANKTNIYQTDNMPQNDEPKVLTTSEKNVQTENLTEPTAWFQTPPNPPPDMPQNTSSPCVKISKYGKLVINRSDIPLEAPDEEIRTIYAKLKHWSWIDDCTDTLAIYTQLRPIIQEGPQCGLVSLSMLSQVMPTTLSVDFVLKEAQVRGISKQGEMFSAEAMQDLINSLITEVTAKVERNFLSSPANVIKTLLDGDFILFPYDTEPNHMPGFRGGKKSHWGVLCGCIIQHENLNIHLETSLFKPDLRTDFLWHCRPTSITCNLNRTKAVSMPALNNSSSVESRISRSVSPKTGYIRLGEGRASKRIKENVTNVQIEEAWYENVTDIIVLYRQSKSRKLMCANLGDLYRSNNQLFSYNNENDEYIIDSVEDGLCGKVVVVHKEKPALSDLLGLLQNESEVMV